MSLNNAIKFIDEARRNSDLRTKLNTAADNATREEILHELDLVFNYAEFEDAYNSMLANCQFEEQADDLKNFKLWWDFLLHY